MVAHVAAAGSLRRITSRPRRSCVSLTTTSEALSIDRIGPEIGSSPAIALRRKRIGMSWVTTSGEARVVAQHPLEAAHVARQGVDAALAASGGPGLRAVLVAPGPVLGDRGALEVAQVDVVEVRAHLARHLAALQEDRLGLAGARKAGAHAEIDRQGLHARLQLGHLGAGRWR